MVVLKESFVVVIKSYQEQIFWDVETESAIDDVIVEGQHQFCLIDGIGSEYLINWQGCHREDASRTFEIGGSVVFKQFLEVVVGEMGCLNDFFGSCKLTRTCGVFIFIPQMVTIVDVELHDVDIGECTVTTFEFEVESFASRKSAVDPCFRVVEVFWI